MSQFWGTGLARRASVTGLHGLSSVSWPIATVGEVVRLATTGTGAFAQNAYGSLIIKDRLPIYQIEMAKRSADRLQLLTQAGAIQTAVTPVRTTLIRAAHRFVPQLCAALGTRDEMLGDSKPHANRWPLAVRNGPVGPIWLMIRASRVSPARVRSSRKYGRPRLGSASGRGRH